MFWDVRTVKPLPDYCIYVEIEDGRKGIFDLKPYLNHGVFRELRDLHYFNQVGILFGAVTWPHEQDIAPETLVAEMVVPGLDDGHDLTVEYKSQKNNGAYVSAKPPVIVTKDG